MIRFLQFISIISVLGLAALAFLLYLSTQHDWARSQLDRTMNVTILSTQIDVFLLLFGIFIISWFAALIDAVRLKKADWIFPLIMIPPTAPIYLILRTKRPAKQSRHAARSSVPR